MPSTTTRKYRPVEPICPPWCEGHADLFQPWDRRSDGSGLERHHDGMQADIADVEVGISQSEDETGLHSPHVQLFVNRDGLLTRTEARLLASALLAAADALEAAL